ncbi:cysteine-tryptophan domain-containing zinc finger protein 7 [Cryptomeria japonica]|uniref:cysteine-tryptophan domain-containing zinc finger protein 7 n=1 Tax=Cryptomeria japonica TaxID=3369 RepID=UPI0027DA70E4|nr:cysteine-tryptophan domain-containing zinc finger protein 7 [Cryptomeria japonica]
MLCSFDNCGGGFGNVVAKQRGVVGSGRMEDNELEEGEASCAFYNDFDPDVALSYIDDKIHDVLGHFQKEFEGGVSAENLGAKYGGYGSFLPTHQRSPSVLLQPRTPAIVQNYSMQNLPNEGTVERMRSAAAISGGGANPSKAGSLANHALSAPAAFTADMVNKGDMPNNAMKGSKEMSPLKRCSVAKNTSGNEQNKIPLLRFKVPTDSVQRSKSSAIYSGLGLDNSPSSSFEDSPEDRQESSPGDEYSPVQSPTSIIQIMTSYRIPGGSLLSPLREDLQKLPERYDKASARDAKNRTIKAELQEAHATNRNEFDSAMDFQGPKERKGRSDEKHGKYTEVKKENDTEIGKNATNNPKKDLDFENKTGKDFGSSNLKFPIKSFSKEYHHERTEREVMGDSGKEKIKGSILPKEGLKVGPKDKVFRSDLPKNELKEVDGNMDFSRATKSDVRPMPPSGKLECKEKEICQVKEVRKGSACRDCATDIKKLAKETGMDSKSNDFSKDLTGYKEWNEQKDATNEMSKDKVVGKDFTDEIASLHKENEKEHVTTNKKKQKDMNRKNSSSKESSKEKSRDLTRSSYKDSRKDKHKHGKDSLTSEAFGESMKAHKELKQAPYKDFQRDHIKDVEQEQSRNRKDSVDVYRKDSMKEPRFESMERGCSRAPEREKEREHNLTKVPSSKKLDHASTSEVHVSNAAISHSLLGGMMGTDPGLLPVAAVLINENWVQCDACEKWRLLPPGVDPTFLPQKWLCRMLDWLPSMNRCEFTEDETTQAVRALNGQQPVQCQLDASRGQFQPPGAPASAPVLDIKQAEPSHDMKALKSSNISSNCKKGQVQRTIVSAPGSTNPPNSISKKTKQSSIKSKSLNDVVQPSLEQVQGSTGLSHQAIKGNDSLIEAQKFKQKEKLKMRQNISDEVGYDTGEGSTPRLKAKRKSEGELDVHKHLKKSKAKETAGINEDSFEKNGLKNIIGTPVKISGVKSKKYNDSSSPKQMREGVSAMDKTFRDQVQTSLETDSRGTYSGFESGKVDRRDMIAKKRKMKEWKDSQQEGLPDQEYVKDCRGIAKEAGSETEYRRDKKVKALKSEGKESSASKADKKGKVTRILVASSKDQLANGLDEQSRGSYEKDHEWSQPRVQGVARRVSNGMDMLKRETGYAQPFVAATSSSSKISCSLKNLANIQEVRGSPVESVSSSPMRISKVEKPSLIGRNGLGVEDSIDGDFPCFASPRRFSDCEGDTQSDRSAPVKKIKGSCSELPGSHESCKAFESSLLNSGKVDDSHDRDEKLFSDVNIKDKKSYQMYRTGNATDHLVNNCSAVERLSERKDKDRSQEKNRDRYNSDGCQDRKLPREKIVRDHDREREKNPVHIKGKDRIHDSISDSHEELYIHGKDRRSHEGAPETHAHSPYLEPSRGGKEFVDDKRSNKSDKDRRNDIEWSSKTDSRTKKLGEMRRGNQLKHGLDDNTEAMPSDLHAKQNRDFTSKHQNLGVVPRKDGKANMQKSLQHDLSRGGERLSNHGLSDRNVQSETTTRDKLQAVPFLGDKPNLQGHGSATVCMSNRGTRAEGVATDVSYGEFSKVPRESSKADNLSGSLNCRLKPPTSNGVSGRDPEGALSSPVRRESGQTVSSCMKEAKDLKHMADNLKSKGMDRDSTSLYFNAALKFLKAASLMELCNVENARHGEITQSMSVYTDTAKLCEFCAHTYERNKEMAAAALAYKCMGVAHMRVVHSKNLFISRDQHDLQMAFQSAPSGDSPSSSASDVDNLNNHALMDRSAANPGKVAGSPQVPADHVIAARHRAVYARVLQYTRDTIAAVEAFKKSENAFSVANGSLDDASHESAGISAVKRVMDFHFNDIDTLLHLVKRAMDEMSH